MHEPMAAWMLLLLYATPATCSDFSWDPTTRQLDYAYYRADNYDSTYDIPAVAAASGAHVQAQRRAWNTTCVHLLCVRGKQRVCAFVFP